MSHSETTTAGLLRGGPLPHYGLPLLGALGLGGALGLAVSVSPLLALAALVLGLFVALALTRPDTATLLVVAALYSNLAGVAIEFHNVPVFVAGGVPLALILPLAYYLSLRKERFVFAPILPWIGAFGVLLWIGATFAANGAEAQTELVTFLLEGLALFVLVTNVVRTRKVLRDVVTVLLLVGAFLGALSLFQQLTHTFSNNYLGFAQVSSAIFQVDGPNSQGPAQIRLAGPLGEQNRYAQILLVLIPLGLMRAWGETRILNKLFAIAATFLIGAGVVLTFSRGAMIAVAAIVVFMALLRYIRIHHLVIIGIVVAMVIAFVPAFQTRLSTLGALPSITKSTTTEQQADSSVQSRKTEALAALQVFRAHPILGVGPGNFGENYRESAASLGLESKNANRKAHNLFLGMAAESGLLGLGAFIGIMTITLRGLLRAHKRWKEEDPELANTAAGFMVALSAYLVSGLFLHMAFARYFWLLLALATAATLIANKPKLLDSRPVKKEWDPAIRQ